MIQRAAGAWDWFIGGLADAAGWLLDRVRPMPVFRIEVEPESALVRSADGRSLGRVLTSAADDRFQPPQLAKSLTGAVLDVAVPKEWLFRRELDPVAAESVPYLDGFVRHQIERITPWRAADVYYQIRRSPMPGGGRIGLEVGLVPIRLLQPLVTALEPLAPRSLRIHPQGSPGASQPALVIGQDGSARSAALRRTVGLTLLGIGLAAAAAAGWLWWQTAQVRTSIEEQDRVLEDRKGILARARRRDVVGRDIAAQLQGLRDAQLRSVEIVEALARALPDSAYLTEFDLQKDHLTVSGVSTDMAVLVPALESSGRFQDVTFGAATTKAEAERGDRFHLEMRVVGRAAARP